MSKNIFNSIKLSKPKKSLFDLTHDVKLTTDMGRLTPVMCMECLPGDKVRVSSESLIRFQPLIAPVMHRMDVSIHYFFVPNRILWDNWEKFITDHNSGIVPPLVYYNPAWSRDERTLANYLGIPASTASITELNAFPFAAYQAIFNEYYRDQNLLSEIDYKLIDGDNSSNILNLRSIRNRAWEHDYFTSSLPFAQKGTQVDVPLGDVKLKSDLSGRQILRDAINHNLESNTAGMRAGLDSSLQSDNGGIWNDSVLDPNGTMEVGNTTINDLRRAFKLQQWLERNARGGTRYIESILSHFGVKSSDARLQRPEYITGVKTPIVVSEVLNTTGQVGGIPQGNMAGHAISASGGNNGSYFCEEHGFIMGIMSIMPRTAYMQGVNKMFFRSDSLDYAYPLFANIGEQEVLKREIYINATDPKQVWGYVPRYAEYKFIPNRICGDLEGSLDYWHLGRKFSNEPNLNAQFVTSDPTKRIFAVTDLEVDSLICDVLNKVTALRPLPKYGNPGGL